MSRAERCLVALAAVTAVILTSCAAPTSIVPTQPVSLTPSGPTEPFPDHDIAIDKAPADLAALWRAYDVSEIPGKHVFDAAAFIPLVNASGGAVSDAQAQALDRGEARAQVLAAWASEHVQPGLSAHLFNEPFMLGPPGVALAEGTSVHTPPCSVLPTRMVVYAPSPSLQTEFAANGVALSGEDIPVRVDFAGPCQLTGTTRDGQNVVIETTPAQQLLVAVSLRTDSVLGPVVFADDALPCATDPVAAPICNQVP